MKRAVKLFVLRAMDVIVYGAFLLLVLRELFKCR